MQRNITCFAAYWRIDVKKIFLFLKSNKSFTRSTLSNCECNLKFKKHESVYLVQYVLYYMQRWFSFLGNLGLGDIHCQSKDTEQSKRNPQNKTFSNEGDSPCSIFLHTLLAVPPWGPWDARRK